MGGRPFLRGHFHGKLDELRISKTARHRSDFSSSARFKPDKRTMALYHFDEGIGDALSDSRASNHHNKIIGAEWVWEE